MKIKGLQNWMGILSFVLLIFTIVSLFLNWTVFEEGYELVPEDWEDILLSGDMEEFMIYESSAGLFRLLKNIADKGLGPFAILIMMIVMVRTTSPIGEEALYVGILWVIILLFVILFALFIKLIIQRILGKKAKGILAIIIYAIVGVFSVALGTESFYGSITLWGFVGFAAMLASIILWTVYCRKMGITGKQKTPEVAAPYNYAQAPQIPMQPMAPDAPNCWQCGTQIQAGTTFCGQCGAQQQAQMPQPVYQPNMTQPEAPAQSETRTPENTPL